MTRGLSRKMWAAALLSVDGAIAKTAGRYTEPGEFSLASFVWWAVFMLIGIAAARLYRSTFLPPEARDGEAD